MVNMFSRLQMNASSPNCGHFSLTLTLVPFPWDLNAAFDTMFSDSIIWNAHLQEIAAPSGAFPKSSNLLQSSKSICSSWPMASGQTVTAATLCSLLCHHSLLDPGRVIGAARLNDLGPRGASLVLLVAVAGDRVADLLILADMHDHARGGGGGSMKFILLPCESQKNRAFRQLRRLHVPDISAKKTAWWGMNVSLLLGGSIRCTWQCHSDAATGQAQHVRWCPATYLVLVWRWHTAGHSWWLVWHPETVPSPLEGKQGVKSGTASLALGAQAEDSLCGPTAHREGKNAFYERQIRKKTNTEMPESAA